MNTQNKSISDVVEEFKENFPRVETMYEKQNSLLYGLEETGKDGQNIFDYLTNELTSLVRQSKEERDELADALLDMYGQYCQDGHLFMSAGEGASTILETQGYATFDEAGRIQKFLSKTP